MKQLPAARIAWVLLSLLEEATEKLWNRYDKEFVEFAMQEEKKEVRLGERVSEMDPDSPFKPEF